MNDDYDIQEVLAHADAARTRLLEDIGELNEQQVLDLEDATYADDPLTDGIDHDHGRIRLPRFRAWLLRLWGRVRGTL